MTDEPITNIEFHPFANLFPMMSVAEHTDLVANIKTHGLLHPLTTFGGKLIDGRNRFKACKEADVEPRFEELADGTDPLGFVIATNYTRRHLSESQRALAAARIQEHSVNRADAGKTFKIKTSALKQAETVLKHGTPELIDAVEHDLIPVNIAAKLSIMDEDAQSEACTMKPPELRSLVKKQARIKKTVALKEATAKATEQLGQDVYAVVLADPPWKFETFSENGLDRDASNHYPVMDTAAIKDLPVPSAEDAILFLWATGPMLKAALSVMEAWGFDYRAQFVWTKDKAGTGYWNRGKHELLLIGVKGNIPAPDPSMRSDSVIEAPVGEHSMKPSEVYDMIEDWFPDLPRIELFSRRYRHGWASHGNQLPQMVAGDVTVELVSAD